MPEPKIYEFSKHICALCIKRDTNIQKLVATLGIDPTELLRMINGNAAPTKVARLAKALNSDIRYLEKMADEIRRDFAVKG